jgi:hypothetical protein
MLAIATTVRLQAWNTAMEALAPGTHLVSPRRGYLHHGVYAGNGRVIHYAGFDRALRRGPVEEVPLEHFARGRGFAIQSRIAPKYPAEAIVERARSRLGEDRYHLWTNNCEHFVAWCISGAPRSAQVEALRARWQRAVGALAMLFGRRTRGSHRLGGAPQVA